MTPRLIQALHLESGSHLFSCLEWLQTCSAPKDATIDTGVAPIVIENTTLANHNLDLIIIQDGVLERNLQALRLFTRIETSRKESL
ncbi:hypothetical protein KC19_5G153300 [Ceratodon purpureus]|uniref:Uncharacterized protein n=1 Tax=Ceratodon purpureus TaxID=3225 RepID=A0A8T0I380_CERPU|nr:hypothetical protein KC19_5G153300 [Ceratodon purpureus]